ncbi:MAG: aspartate aminotransferase family protein [Gemmatimonadetes bacterium]|nr:aspartate aminotransferase family protein [Gemmatimonadota bacterium]
MHMATAFDQQISLLNEALGYAQDYLSNLDRRPVFPTAEALRALEGFSEPLPDESSDPSSVLAKLHRVGSPATVSQVGGRYFGFVNGGALPVGVAARVLADNWDQNTAHWVMSPVAARLEEICEGWLADLLGLPEGTAAGFVTGTTLANLSGLAAGRNELLRRRGWDIAESGLYGAPPIPVVVGQHAHAAVRKALSLLGMGDAHTQVVPVDEQGRLRIDHFPVLEEPALVVTQAGNVNSGAFDPFGEVCAKTHASGGWVHVDGAFGLWAAAVPSLADHVSGIAQADSWAVDAHKTLNVPYDCGIVLCRDREALLAAFRATASYLQWSEARDPMRYTPSMSKRGRAVELWAVLKTLGRQGVVRLVEQLCHHARYFATQLKAEGFTIHNDVVLNQVVVSCGDDAETASTLTHIQSLGECWCGGAVWHGRQVIRISVCSWATTREDIDRSVAAFCNARQMARAA